MNLARVLNRLLHALLLLHQQQQQQQQQSPCPACAAASVGSAFLRRARAA